LPVIKSLDLSTFSLNWRSVEPFPFAFLRALRG
jgi:hypothetical protein